jgi:hypothetical protein
MLHAHRIVQYCVDLEYFTDHNSRNGKKRRDRHVCAKSACGQLAHVGSGACWPHSACKHMPKGRVQVQVLRSSRLSPARPQGLSVIAWAAHADADACSTSAHTPAPTCARRTRTSISTRARSLHMPRLMRASGRTRRARCFLYYFVSSSIFFAVAIVSCTCCAQGECWRHSDRGTWC